MGSIGELQKQCRQYEERIRDLERRLASKDETIEELQSKLHKFRSVTVTSYNATASVSTIDEPRKMRTQGISAEPQAPRTLNDFSKELFKVHPKNQT